MLPTKQELEIQGTENVTHLQQAGDGSVSKAQKFLRNAAVFHARQVDLLKGVKTDAVAARSRQARLLQQEVANSLGE